MRVGSIVKLLGIGTAVLIITSCANKQVQFNPSNKEVVMENGRSYIVPRGTTNYPIHTKGDIEVAGTLGLDRFGCRKEYMVWFAPNAHQYLQRKTSEIKPVIKRLRNSNKLTKKTALQAVQPLRVVTTNFFRNRKMGCSRPLSQQQINTYANNQRQQQIINQQQQIIDQQRRQARSDSFDDMFMMLNSRQQSSNTNYNIGNYNRTYKIRGNKIEETTYRPIVYNP